MYVNSDHPGDHKVVVFLWFRDIVTFHICKKKQIMYRDNEIKKENSLKHRSLTKFVWRSFCVRVWIRAWWYFYLPGF